MSNTEISDITGQGKDINAAYMDACGKIMTDAARRGNTASFVRCIEYKEINTFKPAQRTTKLSTAFKGKKTWSQIYAVYIEDDRTGLWMRVKLPDSTDVSLKASVQHIAKDLCLQHQCKTCIRVERAMLNDPNNQIEETYMPEKLQLGTWNFKIEYITDPISAKA